MAKFNVGDVVVIRNDEELLRKHELATKLASLLSGQTTDILKAGMVGKIVEILSGSYVVDFGEGYKGVSLVGDCEGTCTAVQEDLLELAPTPNDCDLCNNSCKEEFKPYLLLPAQGEDDVDEILGFIGEPTELKTSKGNPLCIGDIVEVDDEHITVVVKDENGEYLMGHKLALYFGEDYEKVVKKVSYEKVNDGDVISFIKYVKYEEECDE